MTEYLKNSKKGKYLVHHPNEHYPSKLETKFVRKLRAKHKLTIDELTSEKKFRKAIANSIKYANERTSNNLRQIQKKRIKFIIMQACMETGKHAMHIDTLKVAAQLAKPKQNLMTAPSWHNQYDNIIAYKEIKRRLKSAISKK